MLLGGAFGGGGGGGDDGKSLAKDSRCGGCADLEAAGLFTGLLLSSTLEHPAAPGTFAFGGCLNGTGAATSVRSFEIGVTAPLQGLVLEGEAHVSVEAVLAKR